MSERMRLTRCEWSTCGGIDSVTFRLQNPDGREWEQRLISTCEIDPGWANRELRRSLDRAPPDEAPALQLILDWLEALPKGRTRKNAPQP